MHSDLCYVIRENIDCPNGMNVLRLIRSMHRKVVTSRKISFNDEREGSKEDRNEVSTCVRRFPRGKRYSEKMKVYLDATTNLIIVTTFRLRGKKLSYS